MMACMGANYVCMRGVRHIGRLGNRLRKTANRRPQTVLVNGNTGRNNTNLNLKVGEKTRIEYQKIRSSK